MGSVLAGPRAFIERANRFRKQFGGGMRQAGIIAAGALYALEHHRARLTEDHANARRLAEGIAGLPGIDVTVEAVETNIVMFRSTVVPAPELTVRLAAHGVAILDRDHENCRAVTHLDVSADDIDNAVAAFKAALAR